MILHVVKNLWFKIIIYLKYRLTGSVHIRGTTKNIYLAFDQLSVKNYATYYLINALRKHAYSNILKILQPKEENFHIKYSDIFPISAQNIDCWYSLEPPPRGGSNEYPQSMFSSKNKENNVYPCKQQFYYIKVGFKGVKII